MSKKLIFIILLAVMLPFAVAAKGIGPNVSKYRGQELKWEDGAYGYHVMFKSLLDNKEMTDAEIQKNNPQGDTCKDSSTYTLDQSHIPSDAIIEDAYLVWTAAQPVLKKDDITDNEVQLMFTSINGNISENQIIKGKKAYKVSEAGSVDFEFDGFKDPNDLNQEKSWYTYRVKILDFFKSIQEKGREGAAEGSTFYDGYSLLGNYTLSGLECTNDSQYKGSTEMVADWSIILIYSSIEIKPKKIYLYDGFKAYWYESSEITVTGFEFPVKPEVRITLASHEGDPGLADANPEGHERVKEGIEIQGENPIVPGEWLLISNVCNPQAAADKDYQHMEYTEIFNSISSVYGWSDPEPTCIGGIPPVYQNEEIEYGMDVDTFVMDSYAEDKYLSHLQKGDTRLFLRIGANQDQAITNYMIVSVDTKAPQFDIPAQPEKVACTPANKFKPDSLEGNWCQGTLEHTFALRIQNWGTDEAKSIKVSDTIPSGMEYVPGSTEYATSFKNENGKKIATRWTKIPDTGGFPLETGFTLPNPLPNCKETDDYLSCKDLVMIRFRAKVKNDTAKNKVIENTAFYTTPGVADYRTNLGIPVKLRIESAGCVTSQDAVDLSDCGGEGQAACTKDSECGGEGYVCDKATGSCIDDPAIPKCKNNAEITASIGKNSPTSKTIFVSNPQKDLVIGQIELAGTGENCYLDLDHIRLQVNNNDTANITISDLRMYKDANGNGKIDKEDTLISSLEKPLADEALFSASNGRKIYNNKKNYILFALNASYKEGAKISAANAYFSTEIEEGGIVLSGGIKPKEGLPLKFSTFQFEPDEGFIITTGPHDPEVPAKADINKFQDVLQVRMLSKGDDSTVNSITIKTPSKFAAFGEGITRLAVYEDTDNDGKGDKELAATTTFDGPNQHKFKISLNVKQNEEKFITIKAEPNLGENESFQVILSDLKLNNKLTIYGKPVESKIYENSCDPNLEECGNDDDGGCSLTVIDF